VIIKLKALQRKEDVLDYIDSSPLPLNYIDSSNIKSNTRSLNSI
jgi:hypothetical protein